MEHGGSCSRRKYTRSPAITVLIVLLLSFLAQGCAMQAGRTLEPGGAAERQAYWWYMRYRIAWPEGVEPDWRVDLLLADAVIKPVLRTYRERLGYWRFHRRANRDGAGHQFSFIFYTDRDTAAAVYAALAGDKLTKKLLDNNILLNTVTDDPANNHLSGVEDTSDKNWSEELQKAWPAYIMGVSDMWLQLIEQYAGEYTAGADVPDLLERYGKVNDRITALWKNEGEHAFLHHLNAIFGYEPIVIEKPVRF